MRLVVADTSPVVYLILIDHIDILPQLFETVLVPDAVQKELRNPLAPASVQAWADSLPSWIEVRQVASISDDAEHLMLLDQAVLSHHFYRSFARRDARR